MTPYPSSTRLDRQIARTEEFCEHGDFIIRHFIPDDPASTRLRDVQETKAWVSDSKTMPQDASSTGPARKAILDNIEFNKLLQQKVLNLQNIIRSSRYLILTKPCDSASTKTRPTTSPILDECKFRADGNIESTILTPRSRYISNPNGVSLLALMRTAL